MNEPLYLDWDVGYKDWLKRRSTGRVRSEPAMRKVLESFGEVRHIVVSYRRSSSGRVHVSLHYCGELVFDYSLLLRFLLWDDPARIRHDWFRHLKGESTNRLFDAKWKAGKLGRAGPWVPWFKLP